MKNRKPFTLLLYILFIYGGIQVSAQQVNFKHFSVKEGISQSEIKCIFQDSEGYIWFGTQNGLNKFDKKTARFTLINHRLPGSLINDEFVYGLTSDESFIYINTPPALSVLNLKTGNLEIFNNRFRYEGILITALYEDKSYNLWIGTIAGMDKLDLKRKTMNKIKIGRI